MEWDKYQLKNVLPVGQKFPPIGHNHLKYGWVQNIEVEGAIICPRNFTL